MAQGAGKGSRLPYNPIAPNPMDDSSTSSSGPLVLRFGVFELSVKTGELRKAGALINLPPQPVKVLALLASHQGELISREDIQQQVWGDNTFVDFDHGLNFAITKIRAALGDNADKPRYVETLPRRGYRFIAPVAKGEAPASELINGVVSDLSVNRIAAPGARPVERADGPHAPGRTSRRVRRLWVGAVGLTALLGAAAIWSYAPKAPSVPGPVSRFTLSVPDTDTLVGDGGLALSPNGRNLVYVAWHHGTQQLFRRALDQTEAVPIAGTEGALFPFFSPDGQWIGFFAGNALKKVALAGGPAMTICRAGYKQGAAWGPNGVIVFASHSSPDLMQVADTGGTPRPLTSMTTQTAHAAWPELTLDGRAVLYTILSGSLDSARIVVRSIDTGAERVLVQGTNPRLTPTGQIVFARAGELWAVPFDRKRLVATDSPVKVLEGVEVFQPGGMALFSVARDGSLVHATPGTAIVVALDRTGRADVLLDVPHGYSSVPQPSPDGHRLVLAFSDRVGDNPAIWIYDLDRRLLRRLTFDRNRDANPLWTPDGQRIIFTSDRASGVSNLFWISADGTGVAESLTSDHSDQAEILAVNRMSITADGRVLAFNVRGGIWTLGINPAPKPAAFLHDGGYATFSPDARWLAYQSSDSGHAEIYVSPFPTTGSKWQVSPQGGILPQWSPDGKELFYLNSEFEIMAAAVTSGPIFQAAAPRALFKATRRPGAGAGDAGYAVMPDGQHFVMLQPAGAPRQIQVTLNWLEDLKAHVRTK
jgi:Tol biopolymer transport system component/DNA-binding winged helix-turn-helix (wHTH) protein